ncbi:MAG: YdcF family protein [Clostridia bacterium]|jgi:uncharacterized SAM-binding protein YcdF (DUF218 family)|nr:YdcF family protein [Clostridia bacterium]
MMESERLYNAKKLFEYLYIRDANCVHADLIMGFGHFDLEIPRQCAYLYQREAAPKILFTGGRGSGSAGLAEAEAKVFCDVLQSEFQKIPCSDVIVESDSTNTGENIVVSARVLREANSSMNFDNGIETIIAVASPYRQRRVWLTLQKQLPKITVCNMPPETTFEKELSLFQLNGENLILLLFKEVERIISYPGKGFVERENLPVKIMNSYTNLRRMYEG